MSKEAYEKARRRGVRAAKTRTSAGTSPYLPVLDEMHPDIDKQENLGIQTIPLDHVAGTVTAGRTNAFAGDWMPLLDADSEFAAKWSALYDSQLEEGIREPILAYEYLNRYYVQEGNKRVSVLKSLNAPDIQAKVIRLIPHDDGSETVKIYLEGTDLARRSGLPVFDFSQPGSAKRLENLVLPEGEWTDTLKKDVLSAYSRFGTIFDRKGGQALRLSSADAFLIFLEIYGLEDFDQVGNTELEHQMEKVWQDFVAWPDKPDLELKTDSLEETRPSFLSRFNEPLRIAFLYAQHPDTASWTLHHELGRQYLEKMDPTIHTKAWFNVTDPLETMEEAFKEGYNVIFTVSPAMLRDTIKFGARHPDIRVFNCSLHTRTGHIGTYYHREYESRFLSGILAGILTSNGKIGYVADFPIYGAIASINAFAVGASMVCPEARIYLDWSTTKESIDPIPTDADIVYVSGQGFRSPKEFGLYDISAHKFVHLTSDQEYWGEFYTRIAQKIKNSWRNDPTESTSANYWWGASNGLVDTRMSDSVPEGTRKLIELVTDQMRRGYNPLTQPIRAQDGTIHKDLSMQEIAEMDWLASNITGHIPRMDQFTEEVRRLIRTHGIDKVRVQPNDQEERQSEEAKK